MSAIPCASVNIKTMADGTLRIAFDVEPCNAQAAFALFASPGTPAAIAALKVGYAAAVEPETAIQTPPKGGALAKLAGMWCNDEDFQNFIKSAYDVVMGGSGDGCGDVAGEDFGGGWVDHAKHCICVMCDVKSRAELDNDPAAAEKFHRLIRIPFIAHQSRRSA